MERLSPLHPLFKLDFFFLSLSQLLADAGQEVSQEKEKEKEEEVEEEEDLIES